MWSQGRFAALLAAFVALNALAQAQDVVHFDNGDRLTGKVVAQDAESVAVDVDQVGVVVVHRDRVARVETMASGTAAAQAEATSPPTWSVAADLGLVVAAGNTRTQDYNLALNALAQAQDVVHFDNGDRLTGKVVAQDADSVAVDVDQVGVVVVHRDRVARVETMASGTAAAQAEATSPPTWSVAADLGLVVAAGNTRTQDYNLALNAERSGKRFDNVGGFAIRRASARVATDGTQADTKDQLDASYDLRWKFGAPDRNGDRWYAVAGLDYFRDPLKDIERRITAGLGVGHSFWSAPHGTLATDLGVSQVFETDRSTGVAADAPAWRWGMSFRRSLVAGRLEIFHNHQLLHILASDRGAVWDSDSGIRLRLNDRWHAGLRMDAQYETQPAAGREKADASYAIVFGAAL